MSIKNSKKFKKFFRKLLFFDNMLYYTIRKRVEFERKNAEYILYVRHFILSGT